MLKYVLTVALMLSAGSAHAQAAASAAGSNADATSGAFADSKGNNVSTGGTVLNMMTSVAPNVNHTAPCVIGRSFGLGFVAAGGGRIVTDCQTLFEAEYIERYAGTSAAILHLCKHDETMRQTLVAAGICVKVSN